jgi:hypothetical protein
LNKSQNQNTFEMMLQKTLTCFFENPGPNPFLINPNDTIATFPCISCPYLGADDIGLIQAVGINIVQGFPIPTIIIMDRLDKVRYFTSFSDSTCRSVEETLRMVAAIKMLDDSTGSSFSPADWESNQPTITNTTTGVLKYYQEKYKEENQKKSAEEQSGLLAPLKKKLGGLYESLFGASLDSAEAKALYDFGEGIANAAIQVKEAEEYSKF